jgi:hypothetical protein
MEKAAWLAAFSEIHSMKSRIPSCAFNHANFVEGVWLVRAFESWLITLVRTRGA